MCSIFEELLLKFNKTAYQVAKDTGIASATLSDWKNGKTTPKQDKLMTIAKYFGGSLEYLMTGQEKEGGETYFVNEETKKDCSSYF